MLKATLSHVLLLCVLATGCTQSRENIAGFLPAKTPSIDPASIGTAIVARSTNIQRVPLEAGRSNLLGVLSKSVRPISESYAIEKSLETMQNATKIADEIEIRAEQLFHENLLVLKRGKNALHFPRILVSYDGFAGLPINPNDVIQFKSISQADGVFPSQVDDGIKVALLLAGLIPELSGTVVTSDPHLTDFWETLNVDKRVVSNLKDGSINTLIVTRKIPNDQVLHHFVWPLGNFCEINFGEKDNAVFFPDLDLFDGDMVTVTNLDLFLAQFY